METKPICPSLSPKFTVNKPRLFGVFAWVAPNCAEIYNTAASQGFSFQYFPFYFLNYCQIILFSTALASNFFHSRILTDTHLSLFPTWTTLSSSSADPIYVQYMLDYFHRDSNPLDNPLINSPQQKENKGIDFTRLAESHVHYQRSLVIKLCKNQYSILLDWLQLVLT